MSKETPPLFGKTKFLEGQIDEFLDKLAEGAIYFERGITAYIEAGQFICDIFCFVCDRINSVNYSS